MKNRPLRGRSLDVKGACFGIKFTHGCSYGCATIYIEDDEWWHPAVEVDQIWLGDLAAVVDKAMKKRGKRR